MTILRSQADIQKQVAALWADAISRFPEFILYVPSVADYKQATKLISDIEEQFGFVVPSTFAEAALKWNLGRLVLCNFHFGTTDDYIDELRKLNTAAPGGEWWGDREDCLQRPPELLAIAQSDPFMVLLNIDSGGIYAHAVDDGSANTRQVAPSLDCFLRAVGSSLFHCDTPATRKTYLRQLLAEFSLPDAEPFWCEFLEI